MSVPRAATCAHCGEAFARDAYMHLHVGRTHADVMRVEERAWFEAALAEEDAWLAEFQRHVRASLVALPIVVTYLLILLTLEVSGLGFAWGLLLLPGVAAFGVMVYIMTYTKAGGGDEGGGEGAPPSL